jgi:Uma2 family endonuclease
VGGDQEHRECLHLPRDAVRYPVAWRPPAGFVAEDLSTWPRLDGRLELVEGRIEYMPPCGEEQQDVATDVTGILRAWVRAHPDFVVGSNEAGMLLDGEVRGADAAVWRRDDVGVTTGLRRKPPILAVEIAGEDEDEATLREKAHWYFDHGTQIVWIVLPAERAVVALGIDGRDERHRTGDRLSEHPALPDLTPEVSELFWQLDRRR